jgi:hypothetical protein
METKPIIQEKVLIVVTDPKIDVLYRNYLNSKPKDPVDTYQFWLAHTVYTKESYPIPSDVASAKVMLYRHIHGHGDFSKSAKEKCLICNPKEVKNAKKAVYSRPRNKKNK